MWRPTVIENTDYINFAQIFWRDSVLLPATDGGDPIRIHARPMYYGRPRYDLVEVSSSEDAQAQQPWYGRALAFFDVRMDGVWYRMALLRWLERLEETHVVGATTFRYWSMFPDVVLLSTIVRPVRMITSPRAYIAPDEEDADDVEGVVCFVAIPYGRVSKV